jgi:FAD/FMN-containing dehydrogenase
MAYPPADLLDKLAARLGPKGFTTDPDVMTPWLSDWRGHYHGKAAALLSPADTREVVDLVRLCAAAGVPLVPQGGNTSMAGGATPDGTGEALLLSMRRMNQIRSLDPVGNLAICEAGVILAELHEAALAAGRRFPLTLGAKGSATIGGLASTNAGGTQVLRFGTMRQLVQGLEAVLPDGSLFEGLAPLKKDNRGYSLTHLLVGAEGTLGIITAASLKLVPAIGERVVAWIGVETPEAAMKLLRHLETLVGDAIESFELVPASSLEMVLEHVPGTRAPLAEPHRWYVLVEAAVPMAVASPEKALYEALRSAFETGLAADAMIAANESQAEALWRLRDSISEAEKKDGPATKHDISVPVADMPAFVVEATRAVEGRFAGARVNAFGHLGDGNVHFNVRAPAGAGEEWIEHEEEAVTAFVHDLVTAAGGSISAEHGIGQIKVDELARLAGPARLAAMRAIKQALDPAGIMNPGKLVPPIGPARDGSFDPAQDGLAETPIRP